MSSDSVFAASVHEGWRTYQATLIEALRPLGAEDLAARTAPNLRSVGEIVTHVIGARARWFHLLMGEGGEEFERFGKWDRKDAPRRGAAELIAGLEATWTGMQTAIGRWTPEEWGQTWPGEDDSEPEMITRQWVIWHLIEHDLHHGGEVSITLGIQGRRGVEI